MKSRQGLYYLAWQLAECRWRVFFLKASPARELGSVEAADAEMAHAEACRLFRIGPERQNKILVLRAG
jgi:hypothetical protein